MKIGYVPSGRLISVQSSFSFPVESHWLGGWLSTLTHCSAEQNPETSALDMLQGEASASDSQNDEGGRLPEGAEVCFRVQLDDVHSLGQRTEDADHFERALGTAKPLPQGSHLVVPILWVVD